MTRRGIDGRVAFFGGSFDPPHLGHLGVARAARAALSLDSVLFAPVGAQPLKPQGSRAGFEHRLAMTRLAISGEPGFAVSLADQPQSSGAPNYTLESLQKLRNQLGPESELFCLMGADSFLGLRQWHRATEIPFVAPLIVASRPGQPLDHLKSALPAGLALSPLQSRRKEDVDLLCFSLTNSSGLHAPFYLLPGLDIEISASAIRSQLRSAAELHPGPSLVPEPVAAYIRSHRLYR